MGEKMKAIAARDFGPIMLDNEHAFVTAGSWPGRWLCSVGTAIETLRLMFPMGAKVSGHRWVEHATSKWAGQSLLCERCGAVHISKK